MKVVGLCENCRKIGKNVGNRGIYEICRKIEKFVGKLRNLLENWKICEILEIIVFFFSTNVIAVDHHWLPLCLWFRLE